MKFVSDERLRLPSEPVSSRKEGGAIARKLWLALEQHNRKAMKPVSEEDYKLMSLGKKARPLIGVGLAAPQLGIHKQVCVVKVGTTVFSLMNPVIVEHGQTRIPYEEGCLSFPGKKVQTYRYPWVVIDTLNVGRLELGARDPKKWYDGTSLLLAVAVQHEIAHLHGLLMEDFTSETYPEPAWWGTWKPGSSSGQ